LPGLAVDQRRSRRPYKTSTVNPSQSIDRIALGKFIRKPRTQEQLEQSLLFNTIPPPQHITKRHQAHQEEQGKKIIHKNHTEANPLHQHQILGAGVRYTKHHEQTREFCS
jgi:hypothetical protein